MVRFARAAVATVLLAACPAPSRSTTPGVDRAALRTQIAQAEARRGGGLDALVDLAVRGDAEARALALRGLGRIGGPRARATLIAALRDPARVRAAAKAIGVLASLDDLAPAITDELTAALLSVLATTTGADRDAVIEAIGRAGAASAQPALAPFLAAPQDATRAITAGAYARFGRRKQPLDPAARAALIPLVRDTDAATAAAAIYAFARETVVADAPPPAHQRVAPALAAQLAHESPAVRALAAQALAKQNVVGAGHAELERALLDSDWRVTVEAMRALAGPAGDDAGRDAVATVMARRFAELERGGGKPTEAHVVIEALRLLAPHARRPVVQAALGALAAAAAASTTVDGLTYAWIQCLDLAALARTTDEPDLEGIAACKLPDHLKLPLIAELVTDKVGTLATRRAMAQQLLGHADARVRASAIGTLATLWPESSASDRDALLAAFVAAIGAKDPIFAGAAIDAAPAFYAAVGQADHARLDAAIVARAASETEVELAAATLELVGKQAMKAGLEVCRAKRTGTPAIAAAARSCVRGLGDADAVEPEVDPAAQPLPALTLAFAPATWTLVTTRGTIEIELAPTSAPWAVASIIALTRRGFYDGLELHRVVPNFVVQGGDPTQSGWGGPGYLLPAEPSAAAGFAEGGVGLADAGRDTAGSQWFAMHAGAPHLDARYTWFGRITSGASVANALLIGDRVLTARIR